MIVTRSNWSEAVDLAIEQVLDAASIAKDPERDVLVFEVSLLRSLKEQVAQRALASREPVSSRLIALTADEHLQIPADLLEHVGRVFDVYRQHLTRG